jgi:hypothetical protein
MADISPHLPPAIAKIFAQLNGMAGSTPLNGDTLLGLGGLTPSSANGAEHYLETVYPSPDLSATTLAATEWANYIRFLYQQYYNHFQQRDWTILAHRFGALALLALDAKFELQGNIGPASNGTLIPSMIRPVVVFANGGTKVQNWIQTVAAGWTAPFWTINLNATGSGTLLTPQNRIVLEILGLLDASASPKLIEWQWKDPGNRPLGVRSTPLNHLVNDLNLWEFDQAMLVQKNKQFQLDANFEAASTTELVAPIGPMITTIDYATDEST